VGSRATSSKSEISNADPALAFEVARSHDDPVIVAGHLVTGVDGDPPEAHEHVGLLVLDEHQMADDGVIGTAVESQDLCSVVTGVCPEAAAAVVRR
jgi:hypothetical protein